MLCGACDPTSQHHQYLQVLSVDECPQCLYPAKAAFALNAAGFDVAVAVEMLLSHPVPAGIKALPRIEGGRLLSVRDSGHVHLSKGKGDTACP